MDGKAARTGGDPRGLPAAPPPRGLELCLPSEERKEWSMLNGQGGTEQGPRGMWPPASCPYGLS